MTAGKTDALSSHASSLTFVWNAGVLIHSLIAHPQREIILILQRVPNEDFDWLKHIAKEQNNLGLCDFVDWALRQKIIFSTIYIASALAQHARGYISWMHVWTCVLNSMLLFHCSCVEMSLKADQKLDTILASFILKEQLQEFKWTLSHWRWGYRTSTWPDQEGLKVERQYWLNAISKTTWFQQPDSWRN